MSLAAGSKLGPYEIVAPLGAGGMGKIYRARRQKPITNSRMVGKPEAILGPNLPGDQLLTPSRITGQVLLWPNPLVR